MKPLLALCFLLMTLGVSAQADTTLNEYKGTYRFPDGSTVSSVEVTVQNNSLQIASSIGTSALPRINKDTFNLVA